MTVGAKIDRRPGAGRQPRAGLQQEAVRPGRHRLPDRRLDVGRLPRGGPEADRSVGQAVRLGLRDRRERGHGVALRRAALAGRGRHPERPTHEGASSTRRPASQAATLLQQMATVDHSVYLDNGNGNYANLFNSGKIGDAVHRAVGPLRLPGRRLRHADPPRQPEPPDDLGPRPVGDVRQRQRATQAAWTFLKWFTSPTAGDDWSIADRRPADPRLADPDCPAIRRTTAEVPGRRRRSSQNEQNALKARPVIANYNEMSAGDGPGDPGGPAREGPAAAGARPGGTAGRPDLAHGPVISRAARSEHVSGWLFVAAGRCPDRHLRDPADRLGAAALVPAQRPADAADVGRPARTTARSCTTRSSAHSISRTIVYTAALRAAVGGRRDGRGAPASRADPVLALLPDRGLRPGRDLDGRDRDHLQLAARADLRDRQLPAGQGRAWGRTGSSRIPTRRSTRSSP